LKYDQSIKDIKKIKISLDKQCQKSRAEAI